MAQLMGSLKKKNYRNTTAYNIFVKQTTER